MELSWTTFLLEIVNFLVLVWILKRFLYRPVMDVVARRKAAIDETMAEAGSMREQARTLQDRYEGRLSRWEQERQQARQMLARELDAERARRLASLDEEIEAASEKARVAQARRQADAARRIEQSAIEQGARFAARILGAAAGPDTEQRLVSLAIEDLHALDDERKNDLERTLADCGRIVVESAYPLPEALREQIERALESVGARGELRFEENRDLVAGVRIVAGPWLLDCNVREELSGFPRLARLDCGEADGGNGH